MIFENKHKQDLYEELIRKNGASYIDNIRFSDMYNDLMFIYEDSETVRSEILTMALRRKYLDVQQHIERNIGKFHEGGL